MPFLIRCKNCQKPFQTSRKNQGTNVPCPACGHLHPIPVMSPKATGPATSPAPQATAESRQARPAEATVEKPVVRLGRNLLGRLWSETKLTLWALWDAVCRLGSYGHHYVGERRALSRLNQSLATLGQAMEQRRVGDSDVLHRLQGVDLAIGTAKDKKLSTKGMESERRILLIQLGDKALNGKLPHAGVEKEFSRARELRERHAASKAAKQSSRDEVAPPAGSRIRVAAGGVVLASVLFFTWHERSTSSRSAGKIDGASYVMGEELQWISSPEAFEAESSPYAQAAATAKSGKTGSGAVWNEYVAAYKLVTGRPPNGIMEDLTAASMVYDQVGIDKSGWVRSIRLSGKYHSDERLELLRELPHLRGLDMRQIDFDSITDRGLQSLASLTQLESLDLADLKISEQAVSYLRGLRGLRYLDMSGTRLTDRGMATLVELQSLQFLNVANTKLTEQAVPSIGQLVNLEDGDFLTGNAIRPENVYRHLSRLTKMRNFFFLFGDTTRPRDPAIPKFTGTIRSLDGVENVVEPTPLDRWQQLYSERRAAFESVPYTGHRPPPDFVIAKGHDVLDAIRGMTQLQFLALEICPCEDADLAMVEGMRQLKSIDLSGSRLTAAGFRHLVPLADLRYLNVSNSHASKDDLLVLKDCPRLTDVLVNNCHLTPADLKELGDAMPRAKFVYEELVHREPYQDERACLEYLKMNTDKLACPGCRALGVTKQPDDVFDPAAIVSSDQLKTFIPINVGNPDQLRQLLRQWGLNP